MTSQFPIPSSQFLRHSLACLIISLIGFFPAVASASLTNGANAIDALGQYDDNLSDPAPIFTKGSQYNVPNKLGIGDAYGIAVDSVGHRLFVSDTSNSRILVYGLNSDNTFTDRLPDNVLGQGVFYTKADAITQNGLHSPWGLTYDAVNSRLFVVDWSNDRVLVHNVTTITNGQNASNVLGAPDFTSPSNGIAQNGFFRPIALSYDATNSRLFVADSFANRIIVHSVSSITNGQDAANILGQPNFIRDNSAVTQNGLNKPYGLAYDATNSRLFVSDANNSRIIVYNVSSITNGQNAANVLGQPNFTCSISAITQNGMNTPYGIAYDATNSRLFIGEYNNRRIVVYNVSSITNGQNAANVLGQPDYSTNNNSVTQNTISWPYSLTYDTTNSRLFIADDRASRVSLLNVATITTGQNIIDILGQYDDNLAVLTPVYSKANPNNHPNKLELDGPSAVALDAIGHRLFVVEWSNNRVLVYGLNIDNSFTDRIPDNVLGQSVFYTLLSATSQNGMYSPRSLAYDNTNSRLFVSEKDNHRVTVFSAATITNGQNAANVLGQPNFTRNISALTQNGMWYPAGLAYDGTNSRLFVAEYGSLVKVFSIPTITNGQNAANILGQPNFTRSTAATTQNGLNQPYGLAYDGTLSRLFVADYSNNRVIIYAAATITNGQNAANVLGQPNFTRSTAATTQNGTNNPRGLAYDALDSRLFVSEYGNNRVTIFSVASITDGQNAANVLGQPDFSSSSTAATQNKLNQPYGLAYDTTSYRLFVADYSNSRAIVYDTSPPAVVLTAKPSANHSIVLASDGTTDVLSTPQFGTQTLRLKYLAKSVADFSFNFSSGDLSFASVTATRDDALNAAVIHGINGHTGVSGNITLYVSKALNHTRLRYCSGKQTIGCTADDAWSARWSDQGTLLQTNNGFDASGFTVSVVTLDAEQVWKIVGPISSGAEGEGGNFDAPVFSWWGIAFLIPAIWYVLRKEGLIGVESQKRKVEN